MAFIKSCSIDSRNKESPTCAVVHETKESSLQTSPTDSLLVQLAEHETDDLVVVSSNLGAVFDEIYFVLCNFRSVRKSDRNASGRPNVKNSSVCI